MKQCYFTCNNFGVWLNGPVGDPLFTPCPWAVKYFAVQSTAPRQHCDFYKKNRLIDDVISLSFQSISNRIKYDNKFMK